MDMRARLVAVLGAATIGSGAILVPQSSEAKAAGNRPTVEFHCTLAGKAKGSPALTRDAVCARFVQAIEPALKVRLISVSAMPDPGKGRWVSVQVRLGAPASVEAAFTSRLGKTVRKHPAIAVDVMDKSLDLREIDLLAKDVAEMLRTTG